MNNSKDIFHYFRFVKSFFADDKESALVKAYPTGELFEQFGVAHRIYFTFTYDFSASTHRLEYRAICHIQEGTADELITLAGLFMLADSLGYTLEIVGFELAKDLPDYII